MSKTIEVRDIIYFDLDKAVSLLSQIEGGLTEKKSKTLETSTDDRNLRTYGVSSLFKGEFGGNSNEKISVLETKVLHHDILTRIEGNLAELGMLVDLKKVLSPDTKDPDEIHWAVQEFSYIKVEGWGCFEDYGRLKNIMSNFNELRKFIFKCSFKDVCSSEDELKKLVKNEMKSEKVPDWLIEGMELWINIFMKERLNLRIFPFVDCPDVQVIGNLKQECFVDDLNHIIYSYGSKPNKNLTVFGIITSLPEENGNKFDVYEDLDSEDTGINDDEASDDLENKAQFEKSFRALFPAKDGLESLSTFHKFPRIILNPIAVYRSIEGKPSKS